MGDISVSHGHFLHKQSGKDNPKQKLIQDMQKSYGELFLNKMSFIPINSLTLYFNLILSPFIDKHTNAIAMPHVGRALTVTGWVSFACTCFRISENLYVSCFDLMCDYYIM